MTLNQVWAIVLWTFPTYTSPHVYPRSTVVWRMTLFPAPEHPPIQLLCFIPQIVKIKIHCANISCFHLWKALADKFLSIASFSKIHVIKLTCETRRRKVKITYLKMFIKCLYFVGLNWVALYAQDSFFFHKTHWQQAFNKLMKVFYKSSIPIVSLGYTYYILLNSGCFGQVTAIE